MIENSSWAIRTFLCWMLLSSASWSVGAEPTTIRVATFNVSMNRCLDGRTNPCLGGGLEQALADPEFRHARVVAEVIQRVAPDVVLLNEFNFDPLGRSADLFAQNFLAKGQNVSRHPDGPAKGIEYPYRYLAPSNTGITSGFDLDNNGRYDDSPGDGGYGNDSLGFGEFPGRYGMLILSKYPIADAQVRTFQNFLWKNMPGALLPDNRSTPESNDWYSPEELAVMRLSSKSHWDVPLQVGDRVIHVLASHPTPPVFDGVEDRNGRRNHDEIRLWADYIDPTRGHYLIDDQGGEGPLNVDSSFVILGDLNADPVRGDQYAGAIQQLLTHPRVNATQPPVGADGQDITATFNLRVDYVLPSTDLMIRKTEVFWPARDDSLSALLDASDHRMVWADLVVAPIPEPATSSHSIFWLLLTVGRRLARSNGS